MSDYITHKQRVWLLIHVLTLVDDKRPPGKQPSEMKKLLMMTGQNRLRTMEHSSSDHESNAQELTAISYLLCQLLMSAITHLSLAYMDTILKMQFSICFFLVVTSALYWLLFLGSVFRWMPWDLTDDESTLVLIVAWCCQATSHCLS